MDAPIDEDDLQRLIAAAYRGPSAGNTSSVEMVVLQGSSVAAYWDTSLPPGPRETFPWPRLLNAPVLLIPTVSAADYVDRYGELDKAHTRLGEAPGSWLVPYWWVDGGAAVENVLLAATALHLGACFFGQFEHERALAERFDIPSRRRALGTIAVGHPDVNADRLSRSAQRPAVPVEQRTHWHP